MTERLKLKTQGFCDIINITEKVSSVISKSKVQEGSVLVFVNGSTAGITTIEFEPGLESDLKKAFERLFPKSLEYAHNEKWGDGNGFSHVRASFLKPDLVIPIENGKILLGTWQQIVLVDFDNRPREREVIVSVK
ncbi:YjbQ family protein [Candidatus Dojkabacteria bacterium]|nr:YjbQ family protein [Candidatus Dojkabacteria bacterium]